MHPGKCSIVLFTLFSLMFSVHDAAANGINPPRPSTASTVTALCSGQSGDHYEIFRVRVRNGTAVSNTLAFRDGGTTGQIAITEVDSLTLSGRKADSAGFVTGTLVLRGDAGKRAGKIQVNSRGKNIELIGYDESGNNLAIDLRKCRRVGFSPITAQGGGDQGDRPVPKD